MGLAARWEKQPRFRKACTFLLLGCFTVAAFVLSLYLTNHEDQDGDVGQGTLFDKCIDFIPENPANPSNFTFKGVNCDICQPIGSEIVFTGCDNDCTQWVYEIVPATFSPIAATCDTNFAPTPSPPPGSEILCPIGFYSTQQQTGCDADSLEGIIALSKASLLLEGQPTLEDCFSACENPKQFCESCQEDVECGGVIIGADGQICFVFLEEAEPFCGKHKAGQVTCKPIKPNFLCFDEAVSFDQAKLQCEETEGGSLVKRPNPDEHNIQLARIANACVEAEVAEGCYFDTDTEFCFFIEPDGSLGQDAECNDERGFCCEIETSAPTTSPTASPTTALFFVPDCGEGIPSEMSFDEARACCLDQNADLATILSDEEQDFAYSKCAEALAEFENDCGCWIGLNRIGQPASVDPLDFSWIDGTVSLYENWEDFPLPQPNNLDNRNEECAHMRPFTLGGWNDLPCLGNCDARDTKPFPLCRTFTPAPTANPTQSPTSSPSVRPTVSPTRNPTASPTKNPTTSPTLSPSVNPTRSPTLSPSVNPTVSPTTSPTRSPTRNPTISPTQNPTISPTTSPTESPTAGPTVSPTQSPTRNPTLSPTTSPTFAPTISPTKDPTASPTKSPTSSPTESPTRNPTHSPTQLPTSSPSISPTQNPTLSPSTTPIDPPNAPAPVCVYGDGEEFIFRFFNSRIDIAVVFRFRFENPNEGFLPADEPFYPACFFSSCFSHTFLVGPGEVFEFRSPVGLILVDFPCEIDPSFFCEGVEVLAPDDLPQCTCPLFTFFADDFEQYPGIEAISPADSQLFFERWSVFDGTVDIKGVITDENNVPILDENGELEFVSHFFFNPCHKGLKCVDIDGTVEINFLESNTQAIRPIEIPPSDAFFNRICTLNFFTRGNGRCGKLHKDEDPPIVNEGQAKLNDRCFEFYPAENVPLFDNLTVAIAENGIELLNVLFQDIKWDTPFFPAGLTADIENGATNVSGSFTVFGGEFLETGLNIGPLLDDVDLTCCCPDEEDRFVHRVLEFDQGLTGSGDPVPLFRSDPRELINREPSYVNKRVVSLGLKGSILLEFGLGATTYIYIYEEFIGCCCCQDFFDPDDAMVEASVDGTNFITVLDSFHGLPHEIVPGGDNSIRRFKVDLPNGACFKYIRITDISEEENQACDGFDIVSVEVKQPCCPTIAEPYVTESPAAPPVQTSFGFGGEFSTVSSALAVVGVVGLIALTSLTIVTIQQSRRSIEDPPVRSEVKDIEAEIAPRNSESKGEMPKEHVKKQL